MRSGKMSDIDYDNALKLIQQKLNVVKEQFAKINPELFVYIDGAEQNIVAILNRLFPPHESIDRGNLLDYWDDKDKLGQWDNTLSNIITAFLDRYPQDDTTFGVIMNISTHAGTLANQVKELCKARYGNEAEVEAEAGSGKRKTVVFSMPPLKRNRLNDESEWEQITRRLADGDPALDAINYLLGSKENRKKSFSLFNKDHFKHQIYEKSIENMARAILKQDRELFIRADTSEFADISISEFSARKKKDGSAISGTCVDYAKHYNDLSELVASDILKYKNKTKDVAQIAFALDYWVNVAYELAYNPNLPDLNGAAAIFAGLGYASLDYVLKIIFAHEPPLISDKTRTKYERLSKLLDVSGNFKNLRNFANEHPNAILPLRRLQASLEPDISNYHTPTGQGLVQNFQKHQVAAASASIIDTPYLPNIGEKSTEAALIDATTKELTVKDKDAGVRKFNVSYDANRIHSRLKAIEIQRSNTLTEATPETKRARIESAKLPEYPTYHLRVGAEATDALADINKNLTEIGLVPASDKSTAANILDLYTAAKDLCEGKTVNPNSNKFAGASPLVKAIALAHYIAYTNSLHANAMSYFNSALQQLSAKEKESFYTFVAKIPAYKRKVESTDEIISQFVELEKAEDKTAFDGHKKKFDKQGGANDAGDYGGVYLDDRGNKALFKSEPNKAKVVGEFYASQLVFKLLQKLHPLDPQYADKYAAKVSLAVANDIDEIEKKRLAAKDPVQPDHFLYLKSEFIDNIGDLWAVAYALKKLKDNDLEQFQELEPEQKKKLLKQTAEAIKKYYGNKKPGAVFEATFGLYNWPAIKIPSDFILDNDLLKQFCDMVAARLLFGDFGVHHGNFVVVAEIVDNKLKLRLGSIDCGAGFDGFPEDVYPFAFKESISEYYKNHLLEYAPAVMKSKEMAEAFIAVSKAKDLESDINQIINEENSKASIGTIKKFCERMKMPEALYIDEENKTKLLSKMRKFIYDTAVKRKESLSNLGYGLLLENCFTNSAGSFDAYAPLNIKLLNEYLVKYGDELKEYIKSGLPNYQPNCGLKKHRLNEVINYLDQGPEILEKRKALEERFKVFNNSLQIHIEQLKNWKAELDAGTKTNEEYIRQNYADIYARQFSEYRHCLDSHLEFATESNYQIPDINIPAKKSLEEFYVLMDELDEKTGNKAEKRERASKPVEPKTDSSTQYVLTIGMLGTDEHREQGATLITQLCNSDSIAEGKYQSFHLIDGPGGKPPKENSEHPMLGTYDVTNCERDPVSGKFSLTKEAKVSGACSRTSGLLKGKGTHDAIAEAMLVIETMLNDKHKDGKNNDSPLVINIAGFSRGGDNAVRLANAIAEKYTRKEVVVNIFALDPAPGPMRHDATKARLIPDIVQNYEAVLMRNDPRSAFKARDKRNITVQNANATNVQYHLYRGVHSQGNYFYADPDAAKSSDIDAELTNDVNQSETARLVFDDLSRFAENNGIKLKDKTLAHVQYAEGKARKTVRAARLSDKEKLAIYTRMQLADFHTKENDASKKQYDSPARTFTSNLQDYFLHGTEFFVDRTHMQLVFDRLINGKYEQVIDYYFEKGLRFGKNPQGQTMMKVKEELVRMIKEDPDLYFILRNYPSKPDYEPQWNDERKIRVPQQAKGIQVRISTFYQPDNALNKQWELLITALSPILIGQDKSFSVAEAEQYYKKALAILSADKKFGTTIDADEQNKTTALKQIAAAVNDKKLQHALRKNKSADANKIMISAVCAKLERVLAGKSSYPSIYIDILQALRSAEKDIIAKHLEHDHELVSKLLNDALRAIHATEAEYHGGKDYFKKAIRKCIVMLAATDAPARDIEQITNATDIHTNFVNHLKSNIDEIEVVDNPAHAPEVVLPIPRESIVSDEAGDTSPEAVDPLITNLRACTQQIIQMLRSASEKMNAEARGIDDVRSAFAPRKSVPAFKVQDTPVHRFFYHNPHDKLTPVINPFGPPKFDLR